MGKYKFVCLYKYRPRIICFGYRHIDMRLKGVSSRESRSYEVSLSGMTIILWSKSALEQITRDIEGHKIIIK